MKRFKKTLNSQKKVKSKELTIKAMGTLTKNQRAAILIGRDDDAIKSVIRSMKNQTKFSRLCTYSLNCLGNQGFS